MWLVKRRVQNSAPNQLRSSSQEKSFCYYTLEHCYWKQREKIEFPSGHVWQILMCRMVMSTQTIRSPLCWRKWKLTRRKGRVGQRAQIFEMLVPLKRAQKRIGKVLPMENFHSKNIARKTWTSSLSLSPKLRSIALGSLLAPAWWRI